MFPARLKPNIHSKANNLLRHPQANRGYAALTTGVRSCASWAAAASAGESGAELGRDSSAQMVDTWKYALRHSDTLTTAMAAVPYTAPLLGNGGFVRAR